MRLHRILAAAAVVLAALPARADQAVCANAFEHAQQLRMAGKLTEASRDLGTCVAECPAVLAKDCQTWRDEVLREIPRLTVRVVGSDGCPARGAVLRLDDDTATFAPGARIELDPGSHRITARGGGSSRVQLVDVKAGEDDLIDIALDVATCAPPPPKKTRPTPILTYVLGGVGLAGFATFGGFATWGTFQRSDLDDRCKPSCPDADVDAMQRTFLVADIGLAVGLVATAAATLLYVTRPWVEGPRSTARR